MKTVGAALLAFGIIALVVLVPAFLLMLLLGALHSSYPQIPALGFWVCFLGLWVLSILGHAVRGN